MTNSRYRWVIVAAGGLLGCVAIGGMFSLPVFLQPIARDTGWSVTGVSSAMTIGFLAMAFTSMIWGTLFDRLGPLPVVLTGSIVLAASLGLASLATSLVAFQFIFGLMVGAACAAIFAPMMAHTGEVCDAWKPGKNPGVPIEPGSAFCVGSRQEVCNAKGQIQPRHRAR
jgi:MFS family permease